MKISIFDHHTESSLVFSGTDEEVRASLSQKYPWLAIQEGEPIHDIIDDINSSQNLEAVLSEDIQKAEDDTVTDPKEADRLMAVKAAEIKRLTDAMKGDSPSRKDFDDAIKVAVEDGVMDFPNAFFNERTVLAHEAAYHKALPYDLHPKFLDFIKNYSPVMRALSGIVERPDAHPDFLRGVIEKVPGTNFDGAGSSAAEIIKTQAQSHPNLDSKGQLAALMQPFTSNVDNFLKDRAYKYLPVDPEVMVEAFRAHANNRSGTFSSQRARSIVGSDFFPESAYEEVLNSGDADATSRLTLKKDLGLNAANLLYRMALDPNVASLERDLAYAAVDHKQFPKDKYREVFDSSDDNAKLPLFDKSDIDQSILDDATLSSNNDIAAYAYSHPNMRHRQRELLDGIGGLSERNTNVAWRIVASGTPSSDLVEKAIQHPNIKLARIAALKLPSDKKHLLFESPHTQLAEDYLDSASDIDFDIYKQAIRSPHHGHGISAVRGNEFPRELYAEAAAHPSPEVQKELLKKDLPPGLEDKVIENSRAGTVHTTTRSNKLRIARDIIEASGNPSLPPNNLPAGDYKQFLDKSGKVSAQAIQKHIDSLPRTAYHYSHGEWTGARPQENGFKSKGARVYHDTLKKQEDLLGEVSEELNKGLGSTLALIGALMFGGSNSPAPKPKWTPAGLHQSLIPIAHLESSFGQNTNHAPNPKGDYHTAYGALGLKPITAHEQYNRTPALKKLYGEIKDPADFTKKLKEDPQFYNLVGSAHFLWLTKRHGTPETAAFAWRHGTGAAANATQEAIDNESYVQKYKAMANASGVKK